MDTELTKKALDSLPIPAKKVKYTTLIPNLIVCVQPSGSKSFAFYKKIRGVPTFRKLGDYPALPIERAKTLANEKSSAVERWRADGGIGISPLDRQNSGTFGEAVDAYITEHLREHSKNPARAEQETKWYIDTHSKALKARPLGSITRDDIRRIHLAIRDEIRARGGADQGNHSANRWLQIMRAVINHAIYQAGTFKGENVAMRIKIHREESRARKLEPEEMKRFQAELDKEPHVDLKDYLMFLIWTAARKSDVLAMRWADVDIDQERWIIPDPKNRVRQTVPLIDDLVDILRRRRAAIAVGEVFVFPSPYLPGRHISEPKTYWHELRTRAKIADIRVHDLRRSCASWMHEQGEDIATIKEVLGHSSYAVTNRYVRPFASKDTERAALQKFATASKNKKSA